MQLYTNSIQDRFGNALKGAQITVRTAAGALATLYADNGVTLATNPLTADATGEFRFYAANGRYTFTVTASGMQAEIVSAFEMQDALELQAAVAGGAAQVAADRIVTGQDKAATAADRLATAADRVITALDRAQTGADRTAASGSAGNSASSAGASLTSANNSAASATTAGTNAAASANAQIAPSLAAAAASAAAALATRTAIDHRYRGALAADPATRTDGSANVVGDEVFNSTAGLLKRWNGSIWLESDLNTANLAASGGSNLVGTVAPGTGSVPRTVQDKLRERVSVNDKWIGATDATAATQNALNEAREVRFLAGFTYNLTGDIQIPANTRITIEKGATVINTGGRFTAYNVNDVEWRIDGELRSVTMATAPAKVGWPNTLAGTQNGDERGFLEFGGSDMASASVSGFKVHGSGKIIGDWVGTPNFDDSIRQVNRKGIAGWNCKNMTVQDINISGFEGEQVYAYINTPDCANIKFSMVNSHHCRFNALNFNVSNVTYAGAYRGLSITDCVTDTSYAGIETSAGVITGNYCRAATNFGIWFGVGAGRGPIDISKNTVEDCALQSYALSFSSSLVTPVKDVTITGNKAINSGTDAFAFNKLQGFCVTGNTSRGHAAIAAGKAFAFTNCTGGWVDGNITFEPGAFSTGNLTTVTSIVNQGSNPVVLAAGTAVTANATHFGFGGKYAAVTTYGNRENQWAAWSSDFAAAGTGAEYVFKNGSGGNTVYAAISGKGGTYDAAGSIGGIVIATKKASTAQAAPTATAEFDALGNTLLLGALTTTDIYAIRSVGPLSSGPGVGAATLANAPSAGNPTKWIAIKDGAVDRYVPSWTF